MKNSARWIFLTCCFILGSPCAWAATITVDPGESIQEAIDGAATDDVIEVSAGTYTENINFKGKQITVRSSAGPDSTIIDGGNSGPVVTFNSWEQRGTVLEGFTIRNGVGKKIDGLDYGFGGGILCRGSSPTIQDNLIEQNKADPFTGGLFGLGGGICITDHSYPELKGNTIKNNQAELGGGIYVSRTNDLQENDLTHTILTHNLIYANTSRLGGGIFICESANPQIINNTVADNVAEVEGGGIWIDEYTSTPAIVNTILWNNGDDIYGADLSMLNYCDIEDGDFAGFNGNISHDPQFTGGGDYHLSVGSPCIDAGDSESDYANEPQQNGCRINMGAYGNTSEATTSSDLDADGLYGACDNCATIPNSPDAGTCIAGTLGELCMTDEDCGTGGDCNNNQEDNDLDGAGDICDNCGEVQNPDQLDSDEDCPEPPYGADPVCGDACENRCQADFDDDGNVYPSDLSVFLGEYGRTDCLTTPPPCEADFDDDGNVYPSDLSVFLGEYGRTDCLP